MAMALERTYSKDQILEAYINQINFDRGWYGIQTAARNYFGNNATEVNPAEAAMLAAIPNRPAYYNPIRNPENALRRRNLALNLMVQQGFLLGPHLDMLLMDPDEKSLLDRLMIHKPRKLDKWFDREKNRA